MEGDGARGEKGEREKRGYDEIQRGCGVVWKRKWWFGNDLTDLLRGYHID
jgi:hypothetical protein